MPKPTFSEKFLIPLLLIIILCVVFYDVVFFGHTFKISTEVSQAMMFYGVYGQENNRPPFYLTFGVDAPVYEEPTYEFIKYHLRRGTLPLWNPHQACGYPLVAMIQSGMYFPLNYILYLFPQRIAWDLLILSRFFLAALFTYWLMRALRFRPAPSLVSGICFMLSGPMLLIQNGTANVDILIPLLVLGWERLVRRPSPISTAGVAAVIALMVYAGAPEHVFLNNLFGGAFAIYRLISLRKTTDWKKAVGYGLLAVLLGFGLSSLVLFPFIWNFLHEFWHNHPHGMGTLLEEIRGRIITIALPHFFQKEAMTDEWVPLGWLGGYLGVIPLGLAFISLFRRHKKGLNLFLLAAAFVLISKSYNAWFINWIGRTPLFAMTRFAYHTPPLVAFCAALCAGMGARSVLAEKKSLGRAVIFALILFVIVLAFLFPALNQSYAPMAVRAALFAGACLLAWLCLLLARQKDWLNKRMISLLLALLVVGELSLYIYRVRPKRFDTFPTVPYLEFLRARSQPQRSYGVAWAFFPNTGTGYRVDDLGIFDGLLMQRFVDFINHHVRPGNFVADLRPATLRSDYLDHGKEFLDLLNLRYFITHPDLTIDEGIFVRENMKLVYDQEVKIYERQSALPRAFIVHRAVFHPREESSVAGLASHRLALDRRVVINHPVIPQALDQMSEAPERSSSSARIVNYHPNDVTVEATLEHPGFLVLSDAYHPDWKAFVDGKETPVYEADYLLRAVFLPKGQHRVRFEFHPGSFFWGGAVSLMALLCCGGLLLKKVSPKGPALF